MAHIERQLIAENKWKSSREFMVSLVCLGLTASTIYLAFSQELFDLWSDIKAESNWRIATHILYISIVVILFWGSVVYQLTRLGYINRLGRHREESVANIREFEHQDRLPFLSILIPSYREEKQTIFQTTLSAVLQDYPNKNVVVLIDNDPVGPNNAVDRRLLLDARKIPSIMNNWLEIRRNKLEQSIALLDVRARSGACDLAVETKKLARQYKAVAIWIGKFQTELHSNNNIDQFITKNILQSQIARFTELALSTYTSACENPKNIDDIRKEYKYLLAMFSTRVSSFERKRFDNLSHEPNKAMNLNSYIGLCGASYNIVENQQSLSLIKATTDQADLNFIKADYFITLDADSVILTDYASRLIYELEKEENQKVAVIQTPYSAFPVSNWGVEHVAGATTDIQYIIHQGFNSFNATFWVGSNALIRSVALNDIVSCDFERGHKIKRYIQDRTVIEDTESSIDLLDAGWFLNNYPRRMAYSATPSDYGSLLVQRRRWANGGLIILPKLLSYLFRNFYRPSIWIETFFRVHYLVSITLVNVGLLLFLAYPFDTVRGNLILPLTAIPYFYLYMRDLKLCGYRRRDLLNVYALNLMLIPIYLAGVMKSIQQGITGKKIPFGRTPKGNNRTPIPFLYALVTIGLVSQWYMGSIYDLLNNYWIHSGFAIINASFLMYAITRYMGIDNIINDVNGKLNITAV